MKDELTSCDDGRGIYACDSCCVERSVVSKKVVFALRLQGKCSSIDSFSGGRYYVELMSSPALLPRMDM